MGDLDALADAGEHHRVIADDIAAAQRGEADRAGAALAGVPLACVDRDVVEPASLRRGDDLAHLERGARGRIDLVAVMRLEDLDVVAAGEDSRRDLEQLEAWR